MSVSVAALASQAACSPPGEHTIDGERSPLEAYFVHKSAAGELAVEGEHLPLFDVIIDALPTGPGDPRHVEGLGLDMNEVRPLPQRYFRYAGSLTTPPFSEGVTWRVGAEPQGLPPERIEAIASHLGNNHRPSQPLGEHLIDLVDGAGADSSSASP